MSGKKGGGSYTWIYTNIQMSKCSQLTFWRQTNNVIFFYDDTNFQSGGRKDPKVREK